MSDRWQCPIENWRDITLDSAQIFYKEAEKYLAADNGAREFITGKAFQLMVLLNAMILAVVGFVAHEILANNLTFQCPSVRASEVLVGFLLLALILCLIVFFPRQECFPGAEPSKLMKVEFAKIAGDAQAVAILICQGENYQSMIDKNSTPLRRAAYMLRAAVVVLIAAPFITVFTYFVFRWAACS